MSRLTVLLVAVALLVTACIGADSDTRQDPTTSTVSVPGVSSISGPGELTSRAGTATTVPNYVPIDCPATDYSTAIAEVLRFGLALGERSLDLPLPFGESSVHDEVIVTLSRPDMGLYVHDLDGKELWSLSGGEPFAFRW